MAIAKGTKILGVSKDDEGIRRLVGVYPDDLRKAQEVDELPNPSKSKHGVTVMYNDGGGDKQYVCIQDDNGTYRWAIVGTPVVAQASIGEDWIGDGGLCYQTISLHGVEITNHSKVDIQPDSEVIDSLISDGVRAIWIDNEDGILKIYAVGGTPSEPFDTQCTVTETTNPPRGEAEVIDGYLDLNTSTASVGSDGYLDIDNPSVSVTSGYLTF